MPSISVQRLFDLSHVCSLYTNSRRSFGAHIHADAMHTVKLSHRVQFIKDLVHLKSGYPENHGYLN